MSYSEVNVTGYNANPPEDDGSQVSTNQVSWAKHKEKLGDPLKLAIEQTQENVTAAVNAIEEAADALDARVGVLESAGGIDLPLAVASGGTGQTSAAEAVGELTQACTEDTTPDFDDDYVPTYDASADTGKKVLLSKLLRSTNLNAPVGYAAGAGGTVTQGTSKSTGVTLSKLAGTITTHAAQLNAATTVTFTVTNTLVEAGDVVAVAIKSDHQDYEITVSAIAAGSFKITIFNRSVSNLSEAIAINFVVLKGATS